MSDERPYIHPSAVVEDDVVIEPGSKVWGMAQVRRGARLGRECVIGRNAFIDTGVQIGDRCKVQNNALVYAPAVLGDGVFIGPAAVLTNDRHPRAINPDGTLKGADDWKPTPVTIGEGAAVGANATVRAGLDIGAWALIAAGAVVTRDVPAHALVAGVPARQIGWVCRHGRQLIPVDGVMRCELSGSMYELASEGLRRLS